MGLFLVGLVLKTNPLSHQLVLVDLFEIAKVLHAFSCMRKSFLVLVSSWIVRTTSFPFSMLANIKVKTCFFIDQFGVELVMLNWDVFMIKHSLSDE